MRETFQRINSICKDERFDENRLSWLEEFREDSQLVKIRELDCESHFIGWNRFRGFTERQRDEKRASPLGSMTMNRHLRGCEVLTNTPLDVISQKFLMGQSEEQIKQSI